MAFKSLLDNPIYNRLTLGRSFPPLWLFAALALVGPILSVLALVQMPTGLAAAIVRWKAQGFVLLSDVSNWIAPLALYILLSEIVPIITLVAAGITAVVLAATYARSEEYQQLRIAALEGRVIVAGIVLAALYRARVWIVIGVCTALLSGHFLLFDPLFGMIEFSFCSSLSATSSGEMLAGPACVDAISSDLPSSLDVLSRGVLMALAYGSLTIAAALMGAGVGMWLRSRFAAIAVSFPLLLAIGGFWLVSWYAESILGSLYSIGGSLVFSAMASWLALRQAARRA